MSGDGMPVGRPKEQRAEDEEVERALEQLDAGWFASGLCVESLLFIA